MRACPNRAVAGAARVPRRIRATWYGCVVLTAGGIAIDTAPLWSVAAVAFACVAIPLALAASHGTRVLLELLIVRPPVVIRRTNHTTTAKELT